MLIASVINIVVGVYGMGLATHNAIHGGRPVAQPVLVGSLLVVVGAIGLRRHVLLAVPNPCNGCYE